MSRKSYSPEEIALISSCPYVKSVTPKTVRYTAEFMVIFQSEILAGKSGFDVFHDCSLPIDAIGRESVLQTIRNWKNGTMRHSG